jgi:hypothetical protein
MQLLFDPKSIDPNLPANVRVIKHLYNLECHLRAGITMDFSEQEEWDELLNAALENYVNALNELPL